MPLKDYAKHRERSAARQAAKSRAAREIGPLPPPADRQRRAACAASLPLFLTTYFPETFCLPFSPDHRRVLSTIERVASRGGMAATAMPRGSGKSAMVGRSSIWVTFTGRRRFAMILGAEAELAGGILAAVKTELETNDLLAADWPEYCLPIRALQGVAQRAKGQLLNGRPLGLRWLAKEIHLPNAPGSAGGGAIIRARGLLGATRGAFVTIPGRGTVRPDFLDIDDFQTDASAASPEQCKKRLRVITNGLLGLAGPKKKIAAVAPCTVIRSGDVADQLLDRDKHPAWQGERCRMCYAEPTDPATVAFWDRYAELRRAGMRQGDDGAAATAFYVANREAMDAGHAMAWPERFDADEVSAVQNYRNLLFDKGRAFVDAECNNSPNDAANDDGANLDAAEIVGKADGLARGIVPSACRFVTAGVDVQHRALFLTVAAWGQNFRGGVLEYGTSPPQPGREYAKRTLQRTFEDLWPNQSLESQVYQAIQALAAELCEREWSREDGAKLRVARILVDCGDGNLRDTIVTACARSPFAALLTPSFGRGIGPSQRPISKFNPQPGEYIDAAEWALQRDARTGFTVIAYDANHWKNFLTERWRAPPGDARGLTLYGKPEEHALYAQHWTAEERTPKTDGGRTVKVWKPRPERGDNEFLDCTVLAAVAASAAGVKFEASPAKPANAAAAAKPATKNVRARRRVRYME